METHAVQTSLFRLDLRTHLDEPLPEILITEIRSYFLIIN